MIGVKAEQAPHEQFQQCKFLSYVCIEYVCLDCNLTKLHTVNMMFLLRDEKIHPWNKIRDPAGIRTQDLLNTVTCSYH